VVVVVVKLIAVQFILLGGPVTVNFWLTAEWRQWRSQYPCA
jgi:hypothetical protein